MNKIRQYERTLVTLEFYPEKRSFILRTYDLCVVFGIFSIFPIRLRVVKKKKKKRWLLAFWLGHTMIHFCKCLEMGFIGTGLAKNEVIICFLFTLVHWASLVQKMLSGDRWLARQDSSMSGIWSNVVQFHQTAHFYQVVMDAVKNSEDEK